MTSADEQLDWVTAWRRAQTHVSANDARRILEAIKGPRGSFNAAEVAQLDAMALRRAAGEPLQYVLGQWGFRSLNLIVDSRVLIPRPETEQVVEVALHTISVAAPVVVDLGTGSGAIALSVASEVPTASVYAVDASVDALDVAQLNLEQLDVDVQSRVRLLRGSWFEPLPKELHNSIDLIVTNPPYVAASKPADVEDVVHNWEPHQALYAGPDGLDDITLIVNQARQWLTENGALVVELAPDQAEIVAALAVAAGLNDVVIGTDFAGRSRWITAVKRPN